MQTLKFSYTNDGISYFNLEISREGGGITDSDLLLMSKYIRLLFMTIGQMVDDNKQVDIDQMIRDLMKREGDK